MTSVAVTFGKRGGGWERVDVVVDVHDGDSSIGESHVVAVFLTRGRFCFRSLSLSMFLIACLSFWIRLFLVISLVNNCPLVGRFRIITAEDSVYAP